jgi:hypothetical protein
MTRAAGVDAIYRAVKLAAKLVIKLVVKLVKLDDTRDRPAFFDAGGGLNASQPKTLNPKP